jgi:hypothetical protein
MNVAIGSVAAQFLSGNICFEFSLLVLCSVCIGTNSYYLKRFDLTLTLTSSNYYMSPLSLSACFSH